MKLLTNIVILAGLLLAGGCEQSPAGLPVVKMKIGDRVFHLEVARTESQQEKGLMKRDALDPDHGMIFVFPEELVRSFWMKDTRFPLDILFLDSAGRVVSVHQMRAYDQHNTSSDLPARYAIELSKGAAEAAGVKAGDVLQIPPEARAEEEAPSATRPVR